MAVFLLIRHGNTDWVGDKVAGRLPGIPLNQEGRRQAAGLAESLAAWPITCLCSSPLDRARETAVPLAARSGTEAEVRQAFTEVDYGDWTGRSFRELRDLPLWRAYNRQRSTTRIPGGESILEVQARMIAELLIIRQQSPDVVAAVFSHGDPIRAALAHFAGIHLDNFQRLTIDPGSVSIVILDDQGPRLLGINLTETVRPLRTGGA